MAKIMRFGGRASAANIDIRQRLEDKSVRLPWSGCVIWMGDCYPTEYGRISYLGRNHTTHRLAWQLAKGPIPNGLFLLHHCDVRQCMNLEHLFLGTQADNMADMQSKGRGAKGEINGNSRLTIGQAKEIRHRTIKGESQRKLAREFNVGKSTVARVINGRTWTHI